MKKINKFEKIFWFLILSFFVFLCVKGLLKPGFYPMHDDLQVIRLLEIDKCVKDGQIPCRWAPDMGYGYGYPQFNFYAPNPYYIMEIFHLIGFGFLDSVKIGFILSFLVGVFGIFLLSKSLWGSFSGILAAVFYTFLPYRALNIYVRGAMGELWGMAFLPYVFWSSLNLIKTDDKKYILLFSLSLFFLATSHNITFIISLPLIFIWFALLLLTEKSKGLEGIKSRIIKFILAVSWGLGLSSFFIIPAFFEKDLVHIESLIGGYFNYINHFVGIRQLLFSNYWDYGSPEVGHFDEVLLSIGIWFWTLPFVSLLVFLIKKEFKKIIAFLFFFLLGWFSLFMVHPKSNFIWEKIYYLSFFQFPWRFLGISGFSFSLAASCFAKFFKKSRNFFLYAFLPVSIILVIFYLSFFRPSHWLYITDAQKLSGEEFTRQKMVSLFDYLPIYVKKIPENEAKEIPEVLKGEIEVYKIKKGSNWYHWEVNVKSSEASIRLPVFYFPNFFVEVDYKPKAFDYSNEFGLITLNLEEGKHSIYVRLRDTPIRSVSNFLSLISFLLIPIFIKRNNLL